MRVLIADDHPLMVDALRTLLEAHDIEVAAAVADGQAAVAETLRLEPDLVLMDIRMPAMDGLEALGRILGLKKDIPVILNTAYSHYKDDFMSWAADAYVVKSSDLTQLKNTIREVLDKKKPSA